MKLKIYTEEKYIDILLGNTFKVYNWLRTTLNEPDKDGLIMYEFVNKVTLNLIDVLINK